MIMDLSVKGIKIQAELGNESCRKDSTDTLYLNIFTPDGENYFSITGLAILIYQRPLNELSAHCERARHQNTTHGKQDKTY